MKRQMSYYGTLMAICVECNRIFPVIASHSDKYCPECKGQAMGSWEISKDLR